MRSRKFARLRTRARDIFTSVLGRITRDLRKPQVLLPLVLLLATISSYEANKSDNYILAFAKKLSSTNNKFAKAVSAWIKDNQVKTLGIGAYCVSAFAATPSGAQTACAASAIGVYLAPLQAQWDYAVHAGLLYLWYVARKPAWRTLIVAAAVAAWATDYLTIKQ